MGHINFTITSGALPITVELKNNNVVVDTLIAIQYGNYAFTNLTESNYDIYFTDNNGCEASTMEIGMCSNCTNGYIATVDGCYKTETVQSVRTSVVYKLVAKSYPSYGNRGMLLFSSFNEDGTGEYSNILTPYWTNLANNYIQGPLNRCGVWTSSYFNNQDISFSYCINIAAKKIYYVGIGADNYGFIKLNGVDVIRQDRDNLAEMLNYPLPYTIDTYQLTFKYWYVYPIEIPAGQNILEIGGHNIESVATVGVQIYDNTESDLINATQDSDLNIIFNTHDLVGKECNYENSSENGYHGYQCPDGYSLDCSNPPNCVKYSFYSCGDAPVLQLHLNYYIGETIYDVNNEVDLPLQTTNQFTTAAGSGYKYLFLSIPTNREFQLLDSLGNDLRANFTIDTMSGNNGVDERINFEDNYIYKSTNVFSTTYSTTFTLILI